MLEWKFRLVILLALAVSVAAVVGSCGPQLLNYNW
jgi:hypothetical protein